MVKQWKKAAAVFVAAAMVLAGCSTQKKGGGNQHGTGNRGGFSNPAPGKGNHGSADSGNQRSAWKI